MTVLDVCIGICAIARTRNIEEAGNFNLEKLEIDYERKNSLHVPRGMNEVAWETHGVISTGVHGLCAWAEYFRTVHDLE